MAVDKFNCKIVPFCPNFQIHLDFELEILEQITI
jgi:hypothetical protein